MKSPALCITIHHPMRKPQSKKTQEDILQQMLERIDLLSSQYECAFIVYCYSPLCYDLDDIRSLIAAKAEDVDVSNDGNGTDSETDGSSESGNILRRYSSPIYNIIL